MKMKLRIQAVLVTLVLASLSCGLFSRSGDQPASQSAGNPPKCRLENWRLFISSVDEQPQQDGTKDVIVRLSIQNNDQLWGSVDGPYSVNNPRPVVLATTDGTEYEMTSKNIVLSHDNGNYLIQGSGFMKTPLLAPGLLASGESYSGIATTYPFVFNVPASAVPATFTIDTLQIHCAGDYIMVNGEPIYGGGSLYPSAATFDLRQGPQKLPKQPSANKYPLLKGSRLEVEDGAGVIEFTDVVRTGQKVVVTLNYTNHSKYADGPSFGGYIIGDQGLTTCLEAYEPDCDIEHGPAATAQPGDTIIDIQWIFVVPEGEQNLIFAYVPASNVDGHSNKLYRVEP